MSLHRTNLMMSATMVDESKQLFRIVIGAYAAPDEAASARLDLSNGGLSDSQLCMIGKWPGGAATTQRRRIAGEEVEVTRPDLFDQVWHDAASAEQPFAPWMTRVQSRAILDCLRGGELVLMVSAASAAEQVRASQIQLKHRPSIVQTYSVMA
jgi:hypothetical protein